MAEKKSLNEIVTEKLKGKWCDGIALLELTDENMTINNIFSINGISNSINNYPLPLNEREFSKVTEIDYKKAIENLKNKECTIVSPFVTIAEVTTFDGIEYLHSGGNVYTHGKSGKIIVNDKHRFETLEEIESFGFISDEERKGKWLLF